MPRTFNIPDSYRSAGISALKVYRRNADPRRKDVTPSLLDFGSVRFHVARHFGFCFGVENAVEIAYRAIAENPDRRKFLLSEMIHNPGVNENLLAEGVEFLMNTDGSQRISFSELSPEDIVIVPAFGTTREIQKELETRGIDPYYYDTTCPFVEKVWKRSGELGQKGYTIVLHGKRRHEETRATFSHSKQDAPTLIVRDMKDTKFLLSFMKGNKSEQEFLSRFEGALSEGFSPKEHLSRIGVVNQTTMLATETHEIALTIRQGLIDIYGEENIKEHFADTKDTLCYATYENQSATRALLKCHADLALVVGGYNSSNTSHLVELLETRFPTYYIRDKNEILSAKQIHHFEIDIRSVQKTIDWLPSSKNQPVEIALTSGASCPDKTVDEVIQRVLELLPNTRSFKEVFQAFANGTH